MDPTGTPPCGLNAGQILSRYCSSLCDVYAGEITFRVNKIKLCKMFFFNFSILYSGAEQLQMLTGRMHLLFAINPGCEIPHDLNIIACVRFKNFLCRL